MAHTNSTTNYSLPQFLSTDKPAWLTDVNPAYAAIDTGMHNAQVAADNAQSDATQALNDAASASGSATAADAKASGALSSISEAFDPTAIYTTGEYVIYNNLLYVCIADVSTPGPWTGSTNWNRSNVDSIATSLKNDISNIKIEDLANVSLTTSDNDKLLGVSVSDNNISVSAVSVPDIKAVVLTSSINSTYADSNTIGFRCISSETVNLADLPGYPTGKTILGITPAYAYTGAIGDYYNIAILNINGTTVWCNSKVSGTVQFAVRVLYKD